MILLALVAWPSVFGLQLGAEIPLPECKRMELRYSTPEELAPYTTAQPVTCQQMPDPRVRANMGAVVFTPQTMPLLAGSNLMLTAVMNGKLEGIYSATLDHNNANEIIRQLSAKFGPATTLSNEEVEVENIAVPSRHAVWRGDGFLVDYHSVGQDLDHGSLSIETDAGRDYREAAERARDQRRTPL